MTQNTLHGIPVVYRNRHGRTKKGILIPASVLHEQVTQAARNHADAMRRAQTQMGRYNGRLQRSGYSY